MTLADGTVAAPFGGEAEVLVTIRDVLRFSVSRFREAELFFGHGFVDARHEAAYLIGWALHLPHASFDEWLDARLSVGERNRVLALIEQRVVSRKPAAYLTGEAWLGEFRFRVDERVLVPRSFIADLLGERLAPWIREPEHIENALDLCTGSGCLAVLLADAFPGAAVDAADVSADALAVARDNVDDHDLADRVALIQSDLFAALAGRRYDLIVSNPPYVAAASMQVLPAEYRHEPALGLAAGADGLDIVHRLLREAHLHLEPHGLLVVEIGHNRDALEAAYPDIAFTWLDTPAGDEFVFLLERGQLPG